MSGKILVVYSHPLIAELVRRVALHAGADALCCVDSRTAKRLIEQWEPELLLTDLALPDALGATLPLYAKDRGVARVWGLGSVFRKESYRRGPARDYGTDAVIDLCDVVRDLGPRLLACWPDRVESGLCQDHHSPLIRVCGGLLRESSLVDSWKEDAIVARLMEWSQSKAVDLGIEPATMEAVIESLMYTSGLGHHQSEAV